MTTKTFANVALALLMAGIVSACGPDQANSSNAPEGSYASDAGDGAARAPIEPTVPAPPAKSDNVSSHELSAGIDAMKARVLRTEEAFSKVEPTTTFRYFMHPTIEKDALIEFDVSGLSSVTLSPRIGPLDKNCMTDPMAGEVEMSYALDDATPTRFTVDRNYNQLLIVRIGESKRLTVAVDQGNGVVTCDWFGLGLSHISENATE